ncbi:hypothetical protein GCM10023226_07400 [Nocardioides nanhaiensis]|uniref:Carboxypeptidase regulatory-like domain-containing protein n=2 Tax=Nocardioides nanhaiensis TaxID=1476871 RepID=A0ABP8VVI0_9ACTN
MMVAGLVAVSGTTASAAPRCGYQGCIPTESAPNPKPKPGKNKARINVTVGTQGNAVPRGQVKIVLTSPNGTKRTVIVDYPAKKFTIFNNLRKGRYTVTMTYLPGKNTRFARSSETANFRI